jgi:hypothetical protein
MGLPVKDIATPRAGETWDPAPGDVVRGKVILAKYMPPKPNFDGDKMEQSLRIDLQTAELDVNGNPRKVSVYAVTDNDVESETGFPSRLARAIVDAVIEAGEDDLDDSGGAELAIARLEDLAPTQKGRKGAKDWKAQYTPAPKTAGLGALVESAKASQKADPFASVPATADPFAGLQGEPVGLIQPQIQPQHRERAAAIFGMDVPTLVGTPPDVLAELIKNKGLDAAGALQVLEGLYGDHTIALTAVASAYQAPEPPPSVDPLAAMLGQ